MATVSFNVKDAILPEVIDAIAALAGYSATNPDGTANPVTKDQFAKQQIKAWCRNQLQEHRNRTAIATAAATDSEV